MRLLGGHRLWLAFNDGREGEVEWRDEAGGPLTTPLEDPDFFAQVRLNAESGTLEWPNGLDYAPEYLYFLAFANDPQWHEQFVAWGYLQQGQATRPAA